MRKLLLLAFLVLAVTSPLSCMEANNPSCLLKILLGSKVNIKSVCLNNDGSLLACSIGSDVCIYDTNDGSAKFVLQGHEDTVKVMCFSPKSRYFVSGAQDCKIKIWDLQTGELLKTYDSDYIWGLPADFICFDPDNDEYFAVICRSCQWGKQQTVRSFNIGMNRTLYQNDTQNYCNQLIFGIGFERSTLRWLRKEFSALDQWCRDGEVCCPDLKKGAYCMNNCVVIIKKDGVMIPLGRHTDEITSVDFSHDGKYVASASRDKTINLWNANTGEFMGTLKTGGGTTLCVSFSADGRRLVSLSEKNTIRVWDLSFLRNNSMV